MKSKYYDYVKALEMRNMIIICMTIGDGNKAYDFTKELVKEVRKPRLH